MGFGPIVHVTHPAAYGLSLALTPDLYRYDWPWLYGLSLFLLSSLATALKGAKSFFHTLLLGHKCAVVYFAVVYYEAVKTAAVFPLAAASFVASTSSSTASPTPLLRTLGRLAEAQLA